MRPCQMSRPSWRTSSIIQRCLLFLVFVPVELLSCNWRTFLSKVLTRGTSSGLPSWLTVVTVSESHSSGDLVEAPDFWTSNYAWMRLVGRGGQWRGPSARWHCGTQEFIAEAGSWSSWTLPKGVPQPPILHRQVPSISGGHPVWATREAGLIPHRHRDREQSILRKPKRRLPFQKISMSGGESSPQLAIEL